MKRNTHGRKLLKQRLHETKSILGSEKLSDEGKCEVSEDMNTEPGNAMDKKADVYLGFLTK